MQDKQQLVITFIDAVRDYMEVASHDKKDNPVIHFRKLRLLNVVDNLYKLYHRVTPNHSVSKNTLSTLSDDETNFEARLQEATLYVNDALSTYEYSAKPICNYGADGTAFAGFLITRHERQMEIIMSARSITSLEPVIVLEQLFRMDCATAVKNGSTAEEAVVSVLSQKFDSTDSAVYNVFRF